MRICIIQAATPNMAYQYTQTRPINQGYCKAHGYDYQFVELEGCDHSVVLKKPSLVRMFLGNYDYALLMDCDAWVNNYTIKIEDFLEQHNALEASLVAGNEVSPTSLRKNEPEVYINSGVLLFKNDQHARNILDKWENPPATMVEFRNKRSFMVDQPILCYRALFDNETSEYTRVLPRAAGFNYVPNNIDDCPDEAFIIHFAGTNHMQGKRKRDFLQATDKKINELNRSIK